MGAYEEGEETYYQEHELKMNPYDPREAEFDEWEDGYFDAEARESEDVLNTL